MGQKKLQRFAEIATFENVMQYPEGMQGRWKEYFGNENPLVLELACGKGEYAVGMGRMFADRNFIGIDLKGNRIWRGAKTALQEGLKNVAFIRSQIDKITNYFVPGEVSEIWITFPDPQLRTSKARKRLTHPRFLRLYQQILRNGGTIHLKTDSPDLYRFTLRVIEVFELNVLQNVEDVYAHAQSDERLLIKTHYERLDIAGSKRIHYLEFALPAVTLPNKDEELKQIIVEEESGRRS